MQTSLTFAVQWGDMDSLGHVNNTVYLRWFESARIQLFIDAGLPPLRADKPGLGPILATQTCDYLVAATFPAILTVTARATKCGKTSITMEYDLHRAGKPEERLARGSSVVVMLDYATGEKVPVPDWLRAAMLQE